MWGNERAIGIVVCAYVEMHEALAKYVICQVFSAKQLYYNSTINFDGKPRCRTVLYVGRYESLKIQNVDLFCNKML